MKHFDNICKALEYIDSHLNDQIDFEKLADIFYFSPYYFHRMFSMITGKTITAHIRDRRLEKACIQLSGTNKTLLEICLDCGFNSSPSFCRAFKNKYGIAPNEYRKQKYIPTIMTVDDMIAHFEKQLEGSSVMNNNIIKDIEELTKKITLEPDNAKFFCERGELYHALKKHNDAKNDFMRAIELEPANPLYYIYRLICITWTEQINEAIKEYTEKMESNHHKSYDFYYRGVSYHLLGEYEKSVADFKKAMEIDTGNVKCFNYLTRLSNNIVIFLGKSFLVDNNETNVFINEKLTKKIKSLRSELKDKLGVNLPLITFGDNNKISDSEIIVALDGVTVWWRDGLLNESMDKRVEEIIGVIRELYA